jgi:AhpD family alkylhydroperoxidase
MRTGQWKRIEELSFIGSVVQQYNECNVCITKHIHAAMVAVEKQ